MSVTVRRLSRYTSVGFAISLLAGCAAMTQHPQGSDSSGAAAPALVGTQWSFSATDASEEAANFLLQPPSQQQLADEEDDRLRLVGSNGCNRLMGPVVLDESRQTLDIGPLASTMKMCPNPEQSNAFNRMLEDVASYQIIGSGESARLRVMDDTGYLLATFMPLEGAAE
ncbi:META domain-containing protein [Cobetia sp. 1CM21F]|uniref:META domain-containing protein n=1 Tax=Cobetia sp. 1CM21F TaxID=2929163 RepID=UPI000D1AAAEE|nr:META domain-containing protein [Cobetia sp. 1CM21F]AVV33905.1 hypothetical protein C8233_09780 [Halomonas sp. SF2003]MCK8068628.1 META domain-containing protein [Cobetia sp. 1CM21F]